MAAPRREPQEGDGFAALSIIVAILLPPIGIVMGSVALRRGDSRGWWPFAFGIGFTILLGILILRA